MGSEMCIRDSHHVCVFVYKHDVSYTQAERATERPKKNDGVAPSPSRKTRRRNEPPQGQGRRLRSTQARRRRAPVDGTGRRREYTRSSSGQRAAHVIPQTHNQAATQKNNTRRERLAQARITNQGPGPATTSLTSSHHRETRQQSCATKARSRRRVPTATHSARPQKHERRAQELSLIHI